MRTRARSLTIAASLACAVLCGPSAAISQHPAPALGGTDAGLQTPGQAHALSWPDPPAPARVHYTGELTPRSSRSAPSLLGRLWRAVTGASEPEGMGQPYGLAVSHDQQLYVADAASGTIHVFNLRRRGYRQIRVPARSPVGVAVWSDRLFVTDAAGARVLCLEAGGRRLWSTPPDSGLRRPTGIVFAAGRLFVVDTLAGQVVEIGAGGAIRNRFGGRGETEGRFNFPTSLATDGKDRLYVADTLNFRIQAFTLDGQPVGSFGRLGDGTGDMNRPKGVAVDPDGNVHVVEGLHDVVQVFDRDGRFLLAYGGSGTGPGQLWLPTGIAMAREAIYVADAANRRVQVYRYVGERR